MKVATSLHQQLLTSILAWSSRQRCQRLSIVWGGSDANSLVFNNNGVEPSKVTFFYEDGKMVSVEAYVSVNSNDKMSHFNKWDAVMYDKKSDFPNFEGINDDLKKSYTKHDEFVASITAKTKSAVETMSNSKQAIIFTINDHNLTYYFGPVSPK